MTNNLRTSLVAGFLAFMFAAVLFFLAGAFGWFPSGFNWFKFIPLTILALLGFWLLPWQMSAAMVFGALGDFFGEMKYSGDDIWFFLQMGSFALGHIMIIVWLLNCSLKRKREAQKAKKKGPVRNDGAYAVLMMLLPLALVYAAGKYILPCVDVMTMKYAMAVYACLIGIMWWTALMQKDFLYIVGATLFVASDFILAWNMFVSYIPGETFLIMVPYYLAELTLFVRSALPSGSSPVVSEAKITSGSGRGCRRKNS